MLLEQLDIVEEAKKSIDELKLSKQCKVIELWQTVEQRKENTSQPEVTQINDEEELDSDVMIIEVQDSAPCTLNE